MKRLNLHILFEIDIMKHSEDGGRGVVMAKRRAKGDGSVWKRDNGTWVAQYVDPIGKKRSKTFKKKSDAQDWLIDNKADILRDEFISPTDMTLHEWLDYYINTYKQGNAPATLSYYQDCIKRTPSKLLKVPLQEVSTVMLQETVNELQKSYSPRSVRMCISFISSALKQAVHLNMIRKNPTEVVTLPTQVTIRGGNLIDSKILESLIQWCKADTTSQSVQAYKDLILFLARQGCRPGEARAVSVNDIKDGWITISKAYDQQQNLKETKTHKTREIPISPDCEEMIQRRIEQSVSGLLFESSTHTPLSHSKLARYMSEQTNGKYSPYDLRHTFCTTAVNKGGNLKAISMITGHSVEVLLREYVHVDRGQLKNIIISNI